MNYLKAITLFLITTLSFTVQGQIEDSPRDILEKIPGYIITNSGEKQEGFIKRFGKIKSQKKVKFYKTLKDKDFIKYGPKDIKAYQIANDYYEAHVYGSLSGKGKVFLIRFKQGKINLFNYYLITDKDIAESTIARKGNTEVSIDVDGKELRAEVLAVKDTGEALKFASPKMIFGFKKIMSAYVKDFPELAVKIKKKEKGYGMLGVLNIVEEYNNYFKN